MAMHFELDGRIDRRAKVGDGLSDAEQLVRVEPAEHRPEDLIAEGIDFAEQLLTGFGHPDHHHAAILGHPVTLDEATFGHPVDQAGGIRVRHVQDIRQLAHRHLAVALDRVHDVDLGHAHALAQEPFARGALELGHGRPKIGDDGGREVRPWCVHSSCHVNNIADTDDPVNLNGPRRVQE